MPSSWWSAIRDWRERRAVARRFIPDRLWTLTLTNYPFLRQSCQDSEARLRKLSSLFLDAKQFSGAHAFEITDEMAVAVAAQACLPILNLSLAHYDSFVDIVVHADELVARRTEVDDAGIVHEFDEAFSGEALQDGVQVTLSWEDVSRAGASGEWAYSVVIHEMAHILDMRDGQLDGAPPMADPQGRRRWQTVMTAEYKRLCLQLERDEPTALDPYAEKSLDEFFAVACETFFLAPARLREGHPALYAELRGFFQQDPARRLSSTSATFEPP